MDDFPNDASTSGLYNVRDQPISGINEDFSDVDWIRVTDLKTWHFYNVWFYSSEVRPRSTSLRLVDARGDVIDFLTFGFPDRGEYQHTVTGSGNSLQVRLDWDSELDANTDSIRIFNMNDPQSQVETLTLSNPDGQSPESICFRYSLNRMAPAAGSRCSLSPANLATWSFRFNSKHFYSLVSWRNTATISSDGTTNRWLSDSKSTGIALPG